MYLDSSTGTALRTFDPEEADYFYVPQYSVCYIYPIRGWADFPWFMPPASGKEGQCNILCNVWATRKHTTDVIVAGVYVRCFHPVYPGCFGVT
jgi:hypothetical protein